MRRTAGLVLLLATLSSSMLVGQSRDWESAMAAFEAEDAAGIEKDGILFVGSSSIRLWDLDRWLPEHGAVNRGFGGSQIEDSVFYFDRFIAPHEPRHLVFYAGDNDIAAGKSGETVVADFARFRALVRERLPRTQLWFLSIKPSASRWQLWPEMVRANRLIEDLAFEDPGLTYVDLATPLLGSHDGRPRRELFVADELHLSDAGYRLWSGIVSPLLPFHGSVDLFPLEAWHNHGSSVVELPDGDLLASWFHGSGERQADDVLILGARRNALTREWSESFVLADAPGFPDTNCTLLVDRDQRLWLFWPTILDNRWEGALMRYQRASDLARRDGPPVWDRSDVLLMKPGEDFPQQLEAGIRQLLVELGLDPDAPDSWPESTRSWIESGRTQAADKLTRRLGWFTRAHPYQLADGRILVGLYSDGFSISTVTYSDDAGSTWTMSSPIVGGGNIQPSFARRDDGTLVAFMRDNGPPPKKVQVAESTDRGETWTVARDHPDLADPGAGNEVLALRSGRWIVVHNDHSSKRHRLAVSISDDQGRSFRLARLLELSAEETGRHHYPSVIEARDGTIHVTYSHHLSDALGAGETGKTIRHAWFNEAWLLDGE